MQQLRKDMQTSRPYLVCRIEVRLERVVDLRFLRRSGSINERHPTSTLMDFEVTFGGLDAETNDRGVYQGMTSKQKSPELGSE